MEYDVKRQHVGDRNYEAGDTRVARPDDVAHLVASGVLTEKATVVPNNKALKVPSNKAK